MRSKNRRNSLIKYGFAAVLTGIAVVDWAISIITPPGAAEALVLVLALSPIPVYLFGVRSLPGIVLTGGILVVATAAGWITAERAPADQELAGLGVIVASIAAVIIACIGALVDSFSRYAHAKIQLSRGD